MLDAHASLLCSKLCRHNVDNPSICLDSIQVKGYFIYTNVRLAKIGYVPKKGPLSQRTFCEVDSETVLHLFYECPFTNLFLKKIEDYWFALSNEHEELLQQDVFIGKLGKSDLLNYFIILTKFSYLVKSALFQKAQFLRF